MVLSGLYLFFLFKKVRDALVVMTEDFKIHFSFSALERVDPVAISLCLIHISHLCWNSSVRKSIPKYSKLSEMSMTKENSYNIFSWGSHPPHVQSRGCPWHSSIVREPDKLWLISKPNYFISWCLNDMAIPSLSKTFIFILEL